MDDFSLRVLIKKSVCCVLAVWLLTMYCTFFLQWLRWTMEEWAVERDRHREIPGDSDGRHLLGDGICFLFLTPMALTSAGLCANSKVQTLYRLKGR